MPHILIVEDEPTIAKSLQHVFETNGFSPHCLNLGADAIAHVQRHSVDLIILDIGLPDTSGFEVCKKIRAFSEVPILFLTARSEEIDRVVGLEIGADDYVTKPFSPREVVARVRAILKRTMQDAVSSAPVTENNLLSLNKQQRKFHYCDYPLNLTKAEYLLLQALHSEPEQVFSREQLLAVLGISQRANYDRTIDTHIKSIRAKLRKINAELSPIKTERGFGYRLSWQAQ